MRLSERLGSWLRPVTELPAMWTTERIHTDGDAWFAELLQRIAQARRSVWLETYWFADDALGQRVLDALGAAEARGCEVRLLVDGAGSAAWLRARRKHATDVPLRVWHPLPWAAARRAGLYRRWRWLAAINRRDHRKVCLIDGAEAWVGSFNITACHLREVSGELAWRDSGAVVNGPGIGALIAAFATTWRRAWPVVEGRLRLPRGAGPVPAASCAAVRLNHTIAIRHAAYRDLLYRLRHAQRRIWITNAYVVPRGSLMRALHAASTRGVDVRLLAPARSDVAFMPWVGAIFADALQARGARVFAFLPRMLHAKTMLIDDTALVGSHNLNSRSFLHDLEVEVVLTSPASVAALEQAFVSDCAAASELLPPATAHLPWWQRLLGRAMLLAKRWI
jgi:cardiolipin synthase